MARLIHLNGPSRVGKSTLAKRFVADHPGALALDLDVVAGMIGGWEESFLSALEVARGLAREMAVRHLRSGYDVVLPQLVTVYDQAPDPAFEESAWTAGATYVQVALMVDDDEHVRRLRHKRPDNPVEEWIQASLVEPGSDSVERIRGHLHAYWETHPPDIELDTTGLGEDATYQRLRAVLDTT